MKKTAGGKGSEAKHGHDHDAQARRMQRDGLAQVAIWQFMAFVLLLVTIWVNQFLDFSALWFGTAPRPPDYMEGWVLSVCVVVVAIIAVGHTYEQQRRIIRGLLTVCSYCHRIRIEKAVWEQMEDYITDHSMALISHGICPECYEAVKRQIDHVGGGGEPAGGAHGQVPGTAEPKP